MKFVITFPSVSTDYFDNVMTKFVVNNRTDALKTDINLFFMTTNCQIVRFRSFTHRINYKFMCQANERARISAVVVKKTYLNIACAGPI